MFREDMTMMWRTWCKYKPQDYRVIFDMAEDSNNPKNLDICRQHIVFQHFPMQRLVESPGTWSVNNYKHGQLIARDGNNIDWIYVIKSGEAKVLKYLQPCNIDLQARRRRSQALVNEQSPFYMKRRLLDFVEEREYIKSVYGRNAYRPAVNTSRSRPNRSSTKSAPPSSSRYQTVAPPARAYFSLPNTRQGPRTCSSRQSSTRPNSQQDSPELTLPRLDDSHNPDPEVRETHAKDSAYAKDSANVKDSPDFKDSSNATNSEFVVEETVEDLKSGTKSLLASSWRTHQKEDGPEVDGLSEQLSDRGFESPELEGIENITEVAQGEDAAEKEPSCVQLNLAPSSSVQHGVSKNLSGAAFDDSVLSPEEDSPSVQKIPQSSPPLPQRIQRLGRAHTAKSSLRGSSVCVSGRLQSKSVSSMKTADSIGGPSPSQRREGSSEEGQQVIRLGNHSLPAFIQVETLHPGQVFGLRACLDPEERGPSASLVSGECEVLQINKKFFMKHCDDAIFSLIRLKNKPFPSEEDLIDRLDVNLQWEEYKQKTLQDFLKVCHSARR